MNYLSGGWKLVFQVKWLAARKNNGERAKRKFKMDMLDWNEMYKINIVSFIDSSCRAHCCLSPFPACPFPAVKNIVFTILIQIIMLRLGKFDSDKYGL